MRPASHGAWQSADPHTDQHRGAVRKGVRESLCIWGFDRSEMSGILSEKCCLSWDLKEAALSGESECTSRGVCVCVGSGEWGREEQSVAGWGLSGPLC